MANNWNVLSGADKVRAYANNAADAGVQTSGYDDEILREQRRRRDRDTADEIAAAQRAKYQAALAERRRAHEEALRAWGRRTDIYGQDMMDEEPVDPLAQMIDRQLMLGKGQEFPHSAPRQQGPTLDEALAIAPLEGIKGLTRGALAAPAFLGDIANLGYSGAKVLMGRPEEGIAPSEFPYGFEGATRWLANNVPGLGRDSVFEDVGSVGENIGILNPRAAILPARTLSGGLGKMLRRSPVVPELGRDLALPRPQSAALPAPRPEMDTTRWTDLMKEINHSIDEVNTPTRIPRPRPQRGGINPSELERLQPDLGDAARTLDRINEGPRRAAAQFKQLDPWGNMVDSTPTQFAGGGSVAGMARRLAQRSMPMFQEGMTPSMSPLGALSVVKPKGGNWLNGSVEDALSRLTSGSPTQRGAWEPNNLTPQQVSMDNWIEGPLTKYVKTRMASPDDEVRRLAEQGVLHIDQDSLRNSLRTQQAVSKTRVNAGFPEAGMSPLRPGERTAGYDWENASDSFISPNTAGAMVNTTTLGGKNPGPTYLRDNPWLATIPPETPVYDFATHSTLSPELASSLGFDHLTDELRNALHAGAQQDALEQWLSKATTPEEIATARRGNPVDLPRHLQLTPDAVKNMSMEKAVRRVADINAWRAAQKAEADQKIAGGPGQELVREYPHSPEAPNPKGLRWVELKATPESETYNVYDKAREIAIKQGLSENDSNFQDIVDDIAMELAQPKNGSASLNVNEDLRNQLKYEGDTMGHCVGGYCDDVLSGRSRIFSLRDAKGEPHVTVEVAPSEYEKMRGDPAYTKAFEEDPSLLAPSITQIKGKQNRKPKDEYLPFVQDFVKNPPHGAPWGNVGDLGNAGLQDTSRLFTPEAIGAWPNRYMTDEEVTQHMIDKGAQELKYASGGAVSTSKAGWEVLN